RGERPVRPGVATGEREERPRVADEERVGQTGRQHDPEGIAVLRGVLGRDPALLAGDRDADRAPLPIELGEPFVDRRVRYRTGDELLWREIAEAEQQLVQPVDVPRRALRLEVLKLELELGERPRVEKLAQLDLAEQLPQLRRIDGERLRAPLGERRVALVDEAADVLEEQR